MRRQLLESITSRLSDEAEQRLIVLRGPTGLGKTTSIRQVAERWRSTGGTVFDVAGGSALRLLPFGGLLNLVPNDVPAAQTELELSQVLYRVLTSGPRPLIVAEDIDRLDPASAALIQSAMQQSDVRVLASLESPSDSQDSPLLDTASILDLPPLTAIEMEQLLEETWGPGSADSIARVLDLAQGNPLYLLELMAAASDSGSLIKSRDGWLLSDEPLLSEPLVRLLRRRLDRFDDASRNLMRAVALMGAVPRSVLCRVDHDAIERLVRGGLLDGDPTEIAQPVFARLLLDDAGSVDSTVICRPIYEAVKAEDDVDVAQLGRWSRLAGVSLPTPAARSAAARAIRQLDYELALHLLGTLDSVDDDDRIAVATARARQGDVAGALESANEVLDGTPAEYHLVPAALLASDLYFFHRGDIRTAIDLLTDVSMRVTSAEARVRLDAALGLFALLTGDGDLARTASHTALTTTGLPPGARLEVLVTSTFAEVLNGGLHSVQEALDETVRLTEQVDGIGDEGTRASLTLALQQLHLGEVTAVTRLVDRRLAVDADRPEAAAVWHCLAGDLARLSGDTHAARSHFAAAISDASMVDDMGALGLSMAELASLDIETHHPTPTPITEIIESHGNDIRAFGRGARGLVRAVPPADTDATAAQLSRETQQKGAAIWALWVAYEAVRLGPAPEAATRLSELAKEIDGPLPGAMAVHAEGVLLEQPERLAEAADQFAALGLIIPACEALCDEIELLRRTQRGEQARRRLHHHRKLIDGLPADSEHSVASRLTEASAAVDPLTPRQREIVSFARRGDPSREIAERLDLSVRTVDNHLAAAFRKLGVNSRDDL